MNPDNMNTIAIHTNSVGTLSPSRGLQVALQPRRAVAEWLPAPQMVTRRPTVAPAATNNFWIPVSGESLGEKAMLLGLTLAAGIGISYGLLCMVNMVQNWAAVQASVGHLIH